MNEEQIRLDQTKKVFEALEQVIKTGSCSYRYLIYDMLGFSPIHYQDLISGLTITNAIVELEELRERINKAIELLKEFHNYENRFKWCEEDYIDTIEKLEEIIKGDDDCE